jgi:hypothetical protein
MRRVAPLVLCLLILNCGGGETPSSPTTPSNLPLQPGRQLLTVLGFGISDNPLYPACVPLRVPRDGTVVYTLVTLEQDGGYWVARSTTPELGDLELRFRESGGTGLQVAGTIRGTGVDAGLTPAATVNDVRVSLGGERGGDATVQGALASPAASMINGRITGLVRFSDKEGNSSTCSAIMWSLQPDRRP